MAINPMKLMQLKGIWDKFSARHPKLQPFFQAVGREAMEEGTIFELTVTLPDGRSLKTNMKMTAEDVQAVRDLLSAVK